MFSITLTSGLANATDLVIGTSSTGSGFRTLAGSISNIEGAGQFGKQLNDKFFGVRAVMTLTEEVAQEIQAAFDAREDSAPFVGLTFEVNSINLIPSNNGGDDLCLWNTTASKFVGVTAGFDFLSLARSLGISVPQRRHIPTELHSPSGNTSESGVIARTPEMEVAIETASTAMADLAVAASEVAPRVKRGRKATAQAEG